MIRMVGMLILSMLLWGLVSAAITYILHLCGVAAGFWCVYSLVLIGTIFYYRLRDPWACPIDKREGSKK